MSPLGSYPPLLLGGLGTLALLLVTGALSSAISARELRLSWRHGKGMCALSLVLVVAAVASCWILVVTTRAQGALNLRVVAPAALAAQAPLAVYVVLLLLLAVAEAVLGSQLRRVRQHQLTSDSLEEAIDTLPDGVCYARTDGRPLLVNTQMDRLVHDVFGVSLTNEQALHEYLAAGRCAPGHAVEAVAPGIAGQEAWLLTTPEKRVWELRRQERTTESAAVIELIATDVTAEQALAAELEQRNARLAEVNQRLRSYGANLTNLTREEEILATKVRVHDELGRALVALRAYEWQDPEQRDRAQLLAQWQRAVMLLRTAAETDTAPDVWEELTLAAQAIQVSLKLEGTLPSNPQQFDAVIALVHECLNNAVRHAGAHEVLVHVMHDGGHTVVRVANDGTPPHTKGNEGGGLTDIRVLIARAGGTMDVQWEPRFAVVAQFDE